MMASPSMLSIFQFPFPIQHFLLRASLSLGMQRKAWPGARIWIHTPHLIWPGLSWQQQGVCTIGILMPMDSVQSSNHWQVARYGLLPALKSCTPMMPSAARNYLVHHSMSKSPILTYCQLASCGLIHPILSSCQNILFVGEAIFMDPLQFRMRAIGCSIPLSLECWLRTLSIPSPLANSCVECLHSMRGI